jgi:hypothetical protein
VLQADNSQVLWFFEQEKDFPNELEVTLTYKDVDTYAPRGRSKSQAAATFAVVLK